MHGAPLGISPEQFNIVDEEYIGCIWIKDIPHKGKNKILVIVDFFIINNSNSV